MNYTANWERSDKQAELAMRSMVLRISKIPQEHHGHQWSWWITTPNAMTPRAGTAPTRAEAEAAAVAAAVQYLEAELQALREAK